MKEILKFIWFKRLVSQGLQKIHIKSSFLFKNWSLISTKLQGTRLQNFDIY